MWMACRLREIASQTATSVSTFSIIFIYFVILDKEDDPKRRNGMISVGPTITLVV